MQSSQYQPPFASFQKGRDLYNRALIGPVERIPVFAQIHEFTAYILKIPKSIFYTRPDIRIPALLEVQAEYDLDLPLSTYDVYNIEAESLGQPIIMNDDCMPDVDRSHMLIQDKSDIHKIKTPNFESSGRFCNVVEGIQLFSFLTGFEPGLEFCAPFSLVANIRGIENFITDIYTDPEFAQDLMNRVTDEVIAPYILFLKKLFPKANKFGGADATASFPIINYKILENWCAAPILRLRELTGLDVYVGNWVGERYLKNPMQMLDLKLKVASTTIQGQDPDVEALGPELFKNFSDKSNIPLVLGVGAAFLAQASPDQVIERVKQYVEVGKVGGKFALYLCNISAATPPENIRAAIEAAHSF
jgi:hypothetical protein